MSPPTSKILIVKTKKFSSKNYLLIKFFVFFFSCELQFVYNKIPTTTTKNQQNNNNINRKIENYVLVKCSQRKRYAILHSLKTSIDSEKKKTFDC